MSISPEPSPDFIYDPNWRDRAECRGYGPEVFYPKDEDRQMNIIKIAKSMCANCVVRQDCLEYAFSHREKIGIWGGMTEKEREALNKKR